MENGMTSEEHLSAFQRACTDKIMRLMPVSIRDLTTGDVSHARPIKTIEVEPMADTYRIRATFYDGRVLTHSRAQSEAHASPDGAAASAVKGLMRAKQAELEAVG